MCAQISWIYPANGSSAGGRIVTIHGDGFSAQSNKNSVSFGLSKSVPILMASHTKLVVRSSRISTNLNENRSVSVNVTIFHDLPNSEKTINLTSPSCGGCSLFAYRTALTPLLSSINPILGFFGDILTISGIGFNNSMLLDSSVKIGQFSICLNLPRTCNLLTVLVVD